MSKRAPFHLDMPRDEVPYSTVVRYSLLSAVKLPKLYYKIYGNKRKRIHPFVPANITLFSEFFGLNQDDVITNQTMFPLLRFCQPERAIDLKSTMLSQNDSSFFVKTVLAHSKISTFYGLKHCPICMNDDLEQRGFTYWHLDHQIPGIEVCHKHGCYLIGVPMGDGYKDRSLMYPETYITSDCRFGNEMEQRLSKFSVELLTLLKTYLVDYQTIYAQILTEKGLKRKSGQLCLNGIQQEISKYWSEINFGTSLGLPSELASYEFLGPLLRNKTHFAQHPCKHILLAGWLTQCEPERLTQAPKPELKLHEDSDSIDNQITEFANQNYSLNEISKLTGKSRCYIKRIVETNNIEHTSNALALPFEVRRSIIRKAMMGLHRQFIADSFDISIGTVEQIISNTKGLSEWRRTLLKRIRVKEAFDKLKGVITNHPDWTRKQIRDAEEAAYFRLYNNDKTLLNSLLPDALKPKPPQKDWGSEDIILLDKIKNIGNIKGMSLAQIGRFADDKSYLKRYLDKLPKTKNYLIEQGIKNL